MNDTNLRRHYETTGKEKIILISREKVKRLCKSKSHKALRSTRRKFPGTMVFHRKEVYSDGWTKWICLNANCGQVKFSMGMTFEEGK